MLPPKFARQILGAGKERRENMNILVHDALLNPPTWPASFRDLTLFVKTFLACSVVIESENPDPYYFWLKQRGGMDFVEAFVRPGTERGFVRLTCEIPETEGVVAPSRECIPTILTDRIDPENFQNILAKIKLFLPMRRDIFTLGGKLIVGRE